MSSRALLIVDVQQALFSTPRFDGPGLIDRLNGLSQRFRANREPVIFVQHCGPEGDPLHPSQPGHALFTDLNFEDADLRISKTYCDAFLDTNLAATLEALGVCELVIVGMATEFCVDTTIRSSLAHGFKTVVPEDGHTTADRPHLPASQVIAHHNATWPWLITPLGGAIMTNCARVA
jgi:nicotinamidase-related amidase